jgi:hypothetical protein
VDWVAQQQRTGIAHRVSGWRCLGVDSSESIDVEQEAAEVAECWSEIA